MPIEAWLEQNKVKGIGDFNCNLLEDNVPELLIVVITFALNHIEKRR